MKLEYLKKFDGNTRLILIAAGWNTTPRFYSPLRLPDVWDIAVIYGFTDLSAFELPSRYSTIYLYAWSFGVVAAEICLDPSALTEAFAISGTPEGIGENGIPLNIFQATRDTLSQATLKKFRRRMLGGLSKETAVSLMSLLETDPDIKRLRDELTAIGLAPKKQNIRWRRAYIGQEDLIIPASAQRRAWEEHPSKPAVVELPSGHWIDMQSVILETIPDTENTALNFRSTHNCYEREASSQGYFAARLAEELEQTVQVPPKRILEIGNGCGTLSRLLAAMWPEAEATYIDLYPIEPGHFFQSERQITADAEQWLEGAEGEWDLIVSSSAVQWFANPARFFANAARLLAPGGTVGCSIYSDGNLCELDSVRIAPLLYHSAARLEEMAKEYFGEVRMTEETHRLEFGNARKALLHLRDTGVRGRGSAPLPDLLQALRSGTLTYVSTRLICL